MYMLSKNKQIYIYNQIQDIVIILLLEECYIIIIYINCVANIILNNVKITHRSNANLMLI